MFLEFALLGFTLLISLVSASPFPQQLENQIKGRVITSRQTPQNSQIGRQKQSQAQGSFEQTQPRSSFLNRGYYQPSSNNGFGSGYSDYEDRNFDFPSTYDVLRPNGDRGFDSYNFQGLGNGQRPGFGGWNRPLRPRPTLGAGDRGFGAGGRGSNSFDDAGSNNGNQLGSGIDNQGASGGSDSGNTNQGSNEVGGSGSGSRVQPPSGGLPWTTVRAPVNRIFGEFTVPEIAECIRTCPSVTNYDPICGSDNITYSNRAKFQCARQCGRVVTEAYRGSCASATTS